MYRNFLYGDIWTTKYGFALTTKGYDAFGSYGCNGTAAGLDLCKHKLQIKSTVS